MRPFPLLLITLLAAASARAEWIPQSQPLSDTSFRAVHAVSRDVVWVSGSKGACLRTVDGGRNWEVLQVPDTDTLDFRGVVAFDEQTAILMSAGPAEHGKGRLYRSVDGGKSWRLVFLTLERGAFLDGIAFWNKRHGIAFGDPVDGRWFVLTTTDGGRNWRRVPPDSMPPLQTGEAAFAASNTSITVHGQSQVWIGSGGAQTARVYASNDRGHSWSAADTPMVSGPTAGIFGLRFWSPEHGIAVGGDHKQERLPSENVLLTDDGGQTWRRAAPTDPAGLKEAVVVLADSMLLAVGPSGTSLSRDRGQTWQPVDNTALHAASCAQGQCWGVGGKGLLVKWQDTPSELHP